MRAWRVHDHGEPDAVLGLEDVPAPVPGAGEAVVQVAAAALNFADVLLCRGGYQERPPLPFTPGIEVSGRVAATGPGVDPSRVGTRVLVYLQQGGGFAEQVLAPESTLLPIPDSLDDVDAAALSIAYQTAYVALHRRARLRPGETLLVHAGAGGTGSAAIELGRAAGARVLATAGGPEKVARCRSLGAEVAIDSRADDFVQVVNDVTDGRGADVVFDPVGGDTFDRSRRCIAFEGRILVIGFAGGRVADAPTNHLLVKNYSVVGVHWGLYARREPSVVRETHERLLALHADGAVAPRATRVVALDDVPAALTALARGETIGKTVVSLTSASAEGL